MVGNITGNESPRIKFLLKGVFTDPQEVSAIIDTGFTGYISMPTLTALPFGLTLYSYADFTLADGSTMNSLLCLGTAFIEDQERTIVVSLSQGNDVLVGTEFLAAFAAKLSLNYQDNIFELVVSKARA